MNSPRITLAAMALFVLSSVGGSFAQAGKNLAATANGGAVVWFTSKATNAQLAHLVDGGTASDGWRSLDGYLPQDFVFAFRNDELVPIEKIILNPKNPGPPETWPTNFLVALSTDNPLTGFEEAGQFALAPEPRDQEFLIQKPARFLKIRLLNNGGGKFTSLGEIKIIEGAKALLAAAPAPARAAAASGPFAEAGAATEQEPNNAPEQANAFPLGQRVQGVIDPLGEEDFFQLAVPVPGPNVLTFDLRGRPHIRTSLALLDAGGQVLKRFDPAHTPAQETAFSWAVKPGGQFLKVTEPIASMVLIWDTSESMKLAITNLQRAVETYLDEVRPSERLKLIRFSKDVEVITPEFLSDPARLRAAAQGKFKPIKGTSLYEALAKGVELLEGVPGNRAIILMTDGSDSSSVKTDHPGLWRLLAEKRIRLYNIALGSGMKRAAPAIGTTAERFLNHTALAMNGRYFYTPNPDELKGLYQKIADEVRSVSAYSLHGQLSRGQGRLSLVTTGEPIASVSAPPLIELILDASGSMTLPAGQRSRMDIAKEVMAQIITRLPDDVRVALRFYGHRIEDKKPGACEDSELVVPFGPIDKTNLLARVRAVKPLGTTPIAYTLRQLKNDFAGVPGEKTVILVTDGAEDCNGKPAEAVQELLDAGLKLRLELVGFALVNRKVKEEMQHVAGLTGGQFHDARDAKSLADAFQSSLAVPYDVLDAAGEKIATGLAGQTAINLPEGIFSVVLHGDKAITIPNVRIERDRATKVALKKEGQEIGIQIQGP